MAPPGFFPLAFRARTGERLHRSSMPPAAPDRRAKTSATPSQIDLHSGCTRLGIANDLCGGISRLPGRARAIAAARSGAHAISRPPEVCGSVSEMPPPLRIPRGQSHLGAVARPIAMRGPRNQHPCCASPLPASATVPRCYEYRERASSCEPSRARGRVVKTCHIGDSMDILVRRQLRTDPVEQRGGGDHLRVTGGRKLALLDRCRVNADTDRLRKNQRITSLCVGIAADMLRPADADDGEAIGRAQAIDGVPPATGMPAAARTDAPPFRICRTISVGILSTGIPGSLVP